MNSTHTIWLGSIEIEVKFKAAEPSPTGHPLTDALHTLIPGLFQLFGFGVRKAEPEKPQETEPAVETNSNSQPNTDPNAILVDTGTHLVVGTWANCLNGFDELAEELNAKYAQATDTYLFSANQKAEVQSAISAGIKDPVVHRIPKLGLSRSKARQLVNDMRGQLTGNLFKDKGLEFNEAPKNTFTVVSPTSGEHYMYHSKSGKWRITGARVYTTGYSPEQFYEVLNS